jgi:hypothetical protein
LRANGVAVDFDGGIITPSAPPFRTSLDETPGTRWPAALGNAAFHAIAGEIVRTIEPHSEADPVALLIQALAVFGSVVGHGPYYQVENTHHHVNLFVTLAGKTAKGRKGTSFDHIRAIFRDVDDHWDQERVVSGLSSGEGLIEAVRDPRDGDEGVLDKRLLVLQSEFSSVLTTMAREGNTLSSIVRCAWDGTKLQTMTRKQNALKATDAHVSVIGHITVEELRRHLDATERANGFGNRFLWLVVARSKLLPDGGSLPPEEMASLRKMLSKAVDFARRAGKMDRDAEARELWAAEYPRLSEGSMGMFGAVTSRAEAQVLRLSMIYALLDSSATICVPHLQAALEMWRYAEDSCRYIFGDSIGDPVADTILAALKESREGLTRTEISALFSRNKSASQIDAALAHLRELGKAVTINEETGGRPVNRWMHANGLVS